MDSLEITVNDHHGQLIYLKDSHKNISTISKLVKDDKTITSDLKTLADRLETTWYMPTLSEGDIMVHCLNTVHAYLILTISFLDYHVIYDLHLLLNILILDGLLIGGVMMGYKFLDFGQAINEQLEKSLIEVLRSGFWSTGF